MKNSALITIGRSLGSSLLLAAALASAPDVRAGFVPVPYTEGFESILDTNYWTLAAPWGPTWETARSGLSCLTDSPWTTYAPNADVSSRLGVDLRFTVRPVLTFWQRYSFEPGQDYGFVEVSKDQGASWTRLSAVTGDSGFLWTQVQVDLAEYAGTQTLIRFRLKSDAAYQYDGWYIDDLQVTDTIGPKRYPFADPMNVASSATNWEASVWQLVVGSATNAGTGMSWRCQIGNGYQPGGDLYSPLTLTGTLNLGAAVNPKLSFWWRAGSQERNIIYAQISTDAGRSWASIWGWDSTWNLGANWTRPQVELNSYIGQTNLALRFLAYNRPGYRFAVDFQVDDVIVDDAPLDVGLTVTGGTDPRHSALLSWTPVAASDFAYYAIYRSASAGVDPSDTLVATITNKATVSFMDTNLAVVGQTYYYRVLVYDTQGLHNWGTNDVSYVTTYGQLAGFPFTENFEGSDAYWAFDWPWAISTEPSHGGTRCLSDSPGTNYANNLDVSAYLRVNLGTATRPMLSFWQRYGFEPGQDYGFVEVSSDNGANWGRWYGVTSQSGSNWTKVEVDLGAYAGTLAIIRFRLRSDGANPYDGWYIDDVELKDFGAKSLGYPFVDNANTTASPSNWIASAWQQVPGSATTNSGSSWRCLIGNGYQPGGDLNCTLTMNGTVNLAGAVNPKLWFWWRAGGQERNIFYTQVSTDGGRNWVSLYGWDSTWNNTVAWTRLQLDLNTYAGCTNLALRFYAYNRGGYRLAMDFQVDDIVIGEQPAPPPEVAAAVGPGPDARHSSIISWSNSAAPAFAWYGLYRSTAAGVTVGNQLISAISNRTTLSFLDTNLDLCGLTYYYRVIVWDTNGLHNLGTSDLAYKAAWGQNVTNLPLVEGFEGTDSRWALDRPWAITTEAAHTGTHSLTDSPGTNYANNADVSAYVNVNLSTMTRPMLSFWHRYALEPNQDFGFVEVSTDNGASWGRWYAVTGQSGTNWSNVQIDLGAYAGTQALIRFRLKSDAQNTYDGWYVDDVEVKDFGLASKSYPFYDQMNTSGSASNWVSSSWQQVPGGPQGTGQSWQCAIGNGYQPGGDLNSCLTLAGTLNLASAVNPKLSFWWRAGSQERNIFYAQASTDGGKTWTSIYSWDSTWNNGVAWTRPQLDMSAYVGVTNLTIRFYAYNRPGYRYAVDFQVDEVLLDEAPLDVNLTVNAGADPRHSALLSWTPTAASDFAYYAVYRSTSAGVDLSDTLLAMITNKATVSFADTNLAVIGQTYYYRVMVYDTQGLHNWGTADVSYSTTFGQLASYPFTEGFESGETYWAFDWPWAVSTEMAHSGTHCLSDSPGTSYANNADASAYLRVNLGSATRPILSWWQVTGMEQNQDYGFVEVSVDNGLNWGRLYAVTGQGGAGWAKMVVDLGGYAGSQAMIRFRLRTDGAYPFDGWYIDDVEIKELAPQALGYPFFDNMDTTTSPSNWVASVWQQVPGSATSGSGMSWRCLIGNGYQPGGDLNACLTMNGTVNLAGAVNPKLWFWWRAGSQERNLFYAQVSTDGGRYWTSVYSWDSTWNNGLAWTRTQVDMSAYIGYTNVALRFLAYNRPGYRLALDFQVDDVLFAQGGECPAILTTSPMPTATLGYGYNLVLQTTNGNPPHLWAVASNSLPPGLTLDPAAGIITGAPTNAGTYSFWLRVTASNSCSQTKQFSLTVQEYLALFPTHSMQAFVSPGTNIVYCQLVNQTGRRLLSLAWAPTLPAGWITIAVTGDGSPALGPDGKILFQAASLTNNPLRFNYSVRVPPDVTQSQQIGGAAIVLLENMVLERTLPAQPNPLFTQPRTYHSSDCNTNWIIETEEINRTLAYWRAMAYQLDPTSCDGYAPSSGSLFGATHSADYRAPFWAIDDTEINRVLSYWRAGCYRKDAAGLDGYAAGCSAPAPSRVDTKDFAAPEITQQAPATYTPGETFTVTNTMHYSGTNLSLLWRPVLPAGWTITEYFADGSPKPEKISSAIVWTGAKIPPTPVTVLYRVQVPAGEQGARQIQSQVEYQMTGMVNPILANASPTVLNISSPSVQFTSVKRLDDGRVQLDLLGTMPGSVRIQFADQIPTTSWNLLTNPPSLNGTLRVIDASATNAVQRFYRTVAP